MVVDLAVGVLVSRQELADKVVDTSLVVAICASVVAERGVGRNRLRLDLLREQVALVEEQNDGRLLEEDVFANFLEKVECFDLYLVVW